jgi:hypothetical protein
MSSAVKTMQLQMERLQEEMSNTLNTEKIRKTRAQERSILAKPNMEFMKGLLDKSSTLREYYDAEDPTTHWLHEYYPPPTRSVAHGRSIRSALSKIPEMIEFVERTSARKMEIINLQMALQRKDSDTPRPKELQEIIAEEQEIRERLMATAEQEYKNIKTLPGRMPPQPLLGIAPVETDTKFLESVYNMFNIQSEQIKTLEAEIQELKKDK